jgi:DNA polymerase
MFLWENAIRTWIKLLKYWASLLRKPPCRKNIAINRFTARMKERGNVISREFGSLYTNQAGVILPFTVPEPIPTCSEIPLALLPFFGKNQTMTSEQKTSLARFLDTAGDYLGGGYARPREAYAFSGDAEKAAEPAADGAGPPVKASKTHEEAPGSVFSPEADTLEGIAADVRSCGACALAGGRTNAAPGEGAERPLVLVVDEAPGQDEDRTGRPFVGKAGQLLDKMLASIGLFREQNCFIANVVKCRPPENRDPQPEEEYACVPFLSRQIRCLKPRIIFCVGRIAANALLGNSSEPLGIGNLRGRFHEYRAAGGEIIPLLATYHPSALLRNEELKRPAWEDLKLLRTKLEGFSNPAEPDGR